MLFQILTNGDFVPLIVELKLSIWEITDFIKLGLYSLYCKPRIRNFVPLIIELKIGDFTKLRLCSL